MAKYKKNFLDNVILRCDFETIELAKLKEFSKMLEKEFPFQEQKEGKTGLIKIKGNDILNNKMNNFREWVWLDPSKKKKLTISSSFISIQYIEQSYIGKTELLKDYEEICGTFFSQFNIETIDKLGLRYINNINLASVKKNFKWRDYFKSNLLSGITLANKTKGKLARSINRLDVRYDNEDLRIIYGVWNNDYPNINTKKEFVLDFDCRSKFPIDAGEDTVEAIKRYNNRIQDLFEENITDNLRKILNKK